MEESFEYTSALTLLAEMYRELGEIKEAISTLEKVIEI